MKQKNLCFVYFMLIITMICWGMSFIWYKQAYPKFKPVTVIQLRLVLSVPLLFAFSLVFKRLMPLKKEDIKYFFFIALFEPFLYFLGESHGLQVVSSTLASILIATVPLFAPFFAYYFFREKLSVNNYLGIVISFAGVLMVVYADGKLGDAPWYGVLLIMLAVFSTQGYAIVLKKLSDNYNALTIVSYQNLIGALYFLPLFLAVDLKDFMQTRFEWKEFLPVFYLSFFASTIAFIFFVQGIKRFGVSKAIVFTNFIPVVTAVLAVPILNETMTFSKAAGIFITIAGLFMS
ncbi:MAG: DMT family transporter, partial [Bacteroidales bacterium]